MATGPEHYLRAEELLETTSQEDSHRHHRMRVAQVHATLALAAATATGLSDHPARDWDAWHKIASEQVNVSSAPVEPHDEGTNYCTSIPGECPIHPEMGRDG